jgi:hypothetical protein
MTIAPGIVAIRGNRRLKGKPGFPLIRPELGSSVKQVLRSSGADPTPTDTGRPQATDRGHDRGLAAPNRELREAVMDVESRA